MRIWVTASNIAGRATMMIHLAASKAYRRRMVLMLCGVIGVVGGAELFPRGARVVGGAVTGIGTLLVAGPLLLSRVSGVFPWVGILASPILALVLGLHWLAGTHGGLRDVFFATDAEPAPGKGYQLHQLLTPRDAELSRTGLSEEFGGHDYVAHLFGEHDLRHSAAYNDPEAVAFIADWIAARLLRG